MLFLIVILVNIAFLLGGEIDCCAFGAVNPPYKSMVDLVFCFSKLYKQTENVYLVNVPVLLKKIPTVVKQTEFNSVLQIKGGANMLDFGKFGIFVKAARMAWAYVNKDEAKKPPTKDDRNDNPWEYPSRPSPEPKDNIIIVLLKRYPAFLFFLTLTKLNFFFFLVSCSINLWR